MSDKELVTLNSTQFARLDAQLGAIANALWAINDQLKPVDNAINNNTTEVTKWLGVIAEVIGKSTDASVQEQVDALVAQLNASTTKLEDAVEDSK